MSIEYRLTTQNKEESEPLKGHFIIPANPIILWSLHDSGASLISSMIGPTEQTVLVWRWRHLRREACVIELANVALENIKTSYLADAMGGWGNRLKKIR